MAGFWGARFSSNSGKVDLARLDNGLDPLGLGVWRAYESRELHLVCCWPDGVAPPASWYYENEHIAVALHGELTTPSFDSRLAEALAGDDPARTVVHLRGTPALAILYKRTGRVRLISDRTSQQPLFWRKLPGGFVFSTSMATFCRLPAKPAVDPRWLYEYFYFNYPIGSRTFLLDVRRMPAATILDFDPRDDSVALRTYAPLYDLPATIADEEQSVAETSAAFSRVVSRSIDAPEKTGIMLTSGMDSRTILSFVPQRQLPNMNGFTYGQRGSLDTETAASMASALGLQHAITGFDDRFRAALPELAWWTVFLSGGLQGVLRSTLPFAYCDFARRRPAVGSLLHGAAGDHLYRDHVNGTGNVPHILSPGLHASLQRRGLTIDEARFRGIFGDRYDDFVAAVEQPIEELCSSYGALGDPVAYTRLLLYEAGPKYFAGESAIAGHWFRLRRPFMNADIVTAALASPYGVAAMSRKTATQDRYRERWFQAKLISLNSAVGGLPLYQRPLNVYLQRSPWAYHLHSLRLLPLRVAEKMRPTRPLLEDWPAWIRSGMSEQVAALSTGDSRLSRYVSPPAIVRAVSAGDLELTGKFLTAEILLRLVDARWQLPVECQSWRRPVTHGRAGYALESVERAS